MKTKMAVSFSTILGRVLYYTVKMTASVFQSCLTLCNPTDGSPPGSSVHGILEARTLEWVAIPFSRGSSSSRGRTWVSCIAGRFFTVWATREASILFKYPFHEFINKNHTEPKVTTFSLFPCENFMNRNLLGWIRWPKPTMGILFNYLFSGLAMWLAGSYFCDQGWNAGPQ